MLKKEKTVIVTGASGTAISLHLLISGLLGRAILKVFEEDGWNGSHSFVILLIPKPLERVYLEQHPLGSAK
jgi:hypothetical protein